MGTYCGSIWCSYHFISVYGSLVDQGDEMKDVTSILYIYHIGNNLCAATSGLWKAAIFIEWNRLFVPCGIKNWFYWIGKSLLAFTSLTHIAYIFTENLSCFPYQRIWDKTITEGYCIDSRIYQIPGSVFNSIYIAMVVVISQRAIWRLQSTMRKKIGISILFLVGLLALAFSIARGFTMVIYTNPDDWMHIISAVYLWTLAENTCCFLALCAPWLPAAISNRKSISNAINHLMLYTRLSWNKQGDRTKSHSWPSYGAPIYKQQRSPGAIDNEARYTTVPLVKYPSTSSKNQQTSEVDLPRGGILMTTEIIVATDQAGHSSLARDPWFID
ncbi:hypothetical protein F4811DRAFT_513762 [Daldinia bambusicola]|nr:hypothetical protein F4811DRAFT_513762 [Daldinia bambusicola]